MLKAGAFALVSGVLAWLLLPFNTTPTPDVWRRRIPHEYHPFRPIGFATNNSFYAAVGKEALLIKCSPDAQTVEPLPHSEALDDALGSHATTQILDVVLSDDGALIAVGQEARLWKGADTTVLRTFDGSVAETIRTGSPMAISPDNSEITVWETEGEYTITCVDIYSRRTIFEQKMGKDVNPSSLAETSFAPDRHTVAVAHHDSAQKVLNVTTYTLPSGKQIQSWALPSESAQLIQRLRWERNELLVRVADPSTAQPGVIEHYEVMPSNPEKRTLVALARDALFPICLRDTHVGDGWTVVVEGQPGEAVLKGEDPLEPIEFPVSVQRQEGDRQLTPISGTSPGYLSRNGIWYLHFDGDDLVFSSLTSTSVKTQNTRILSAVAVSLMALILAWKWLRIGSTDIR